MTTPRPIDLLFSSYRRRILALLLVRPDESFHVRQIARLTEVPAGSLHRDLRVLERAGLLVREPLGNLVRYRANRACEIYPELAEIFRKTLGVGDILREALAPLSRRIDIAFVFGSVARGDEGPSSDVDVLIVGELSFARVVETLSPLQERLGRAVNPVVMTRRDFAAKRAARDRFVTRVLREPKIALMGPVDDLGEPAPHRPTEASRRKP